MFDYLRLSVNHSGVGRGGVMEPLGGRVGGCDMAEGGSLAKKGWSGGKRGAAAVLRMGIALRMSNFTKRFYFVCTWYMMVVLSRGIYKNTVILCLSDLGLHQEFGIFQHKVRLISISLFSSVVRGGGGGVAGNFNISFTLYTDVFLTDIGCAYNVTVSQDVNENDIDLIVWPLC